MAGLVVSMAECWLVVPTTISFDSSITCLSRHIKGKARSTGRALCLDDTWSCVVDLYVQVLQVGHISREQALHYRRAYLLDVSQARDNPAQQQYAHVCFVGSHTRISQRLNLVQRRG